MKILVRKQKTSRAPCVEFVYDHIFILKWLTFYAVQSNNFEIYINVKCLCRHRGFKEQGLENSHDFVFPPQNVNKNHVAMLFTFY